LAPAEVVKMIVMDEQAANTSQLRPIEKRTPRQIYYESCKTRGHAQE